MGTTAISRVLTNMMAPHAAHMRPNIFLKVVMLTLDIYGYEEKELNNKSQEPKRIQIRSPKREIRKKHQDPNHKNQSNFKSEI
jgi:hypothetical protein